VEKLPLIFATVGTDVHPFNRMTDWIDAWLEAGGMDRARCFMQTGTSAKPRLADHNPYLGYTDMVENIRAAAAVVCHGGPGTVMLCASLGKRPIVIPRSAARGEHVDDHQRAFSRRVAADGTVLLAETEGQFGALIDGALDGHVTSLRSDGTDPAATVAAFEELVNRLFRAD
jgi:UDP-N-acetylglucosamine transferase subunit ALG13